jgi:hypothetical protein
MKKLNRWLWISAVFNVVYVALMGTMIYYTHVFYEGNVANEGCWWIAFIGDHIFLWQVRFGAVLTLVLLVPGLVCSVIGIVRHVHQYPGGKWWKAGGDWVLRQD